MSGTHAARRSATDALRIVADVQGMQTPDSRHRGIGNYIGMATQALMSLDVVHHLAITSNLAFPRPDLEVPERVEWATYRAVADAPWGASAERRAAASELMQTCWNRLNPDVVHVGSVFEGFASGAPVAQPFHRESGTRPVRSAFLYDLIPLRFPDHYLRDERFAEWYASRCESLSSYDLLFAISEATRRDAIDLLGIPGHRIVNVGGSCDPRYRLLAESEVQSESLRTRHGIARDYILSVSGDEYRKNIPRLVEAYASMSEDVRLAFDLVVVCKLSDGTRAALDGLLERYPQTVREQVRFLGFVEDDDLVRLYNDCSLFAFPSFYEGLGIPVIEALRCGATAVVGSNSSLVELVADGDRRFDAMDHRSIASCMQRHLVRTPIDEAERRANVKRAVHHSWSAVAERMIDEWERLVGEERDVGTAAPRHERVYIDRPRLAMFTPLPSVPSGIADYSFEFIPHLAKHFAIDVFLGPEDEAFDRLPTGVEHVEWLEPGGYDPREYFATLYEMGNSAFHGHLLRLMADAPGIVTLHDAYISGLVYWAQFNAPKLLSASFDDIGLASHGGAFRRLLEHAEIDSHERAILDWPLTAPVFERSLGVVSHTPFNIDVAQRLLGHRVQCPYRVIPHARDLPVATGDAERVRAKAALGLASDATVITTFGHVSWHKLGDVLVEAFARSKFASREAGALVFAGSIAEPHFGELLEGLIGRLGLEGQVRVTGYLNRDDYERYLAATDLAVQLRSETRGGTSGATLDAVSRAIPVVVNDYGSFSDYPHDAVAFVSPQPTPRELAEVLDRFPSRDMLEGAQRGREFVRDAHAPERCAAAYAQFIRDCVAMEESRSAEFAATRIRTAIAPMPAEARSVLAVDAGEELARQEARRPTTQVLLEVSRTNFERRAHRTGIQRVVRNVAREALRSRRVNLDARLIAFENGRTVVDVPEFQSELGVLLAGETCAGRTGAMGPRDTLLLLDFDLSVFATSGRLLEKWRQRGGRLVTVLYDLIPIRFPSFVPSGGAEAFAAWLDIAIRDSDGIVCISRSVADDLAAYVGEHGSDVGEGLDIGYWPLGTPDLMPEDGVESRRQKDRNADAGLQFLMVSTVEPRKGHATAIDAFETLWRSGANHRLRMVGNEGWSAAELAARIRNHPEFGDRLVWVTGADDNVLAREYLDADVVLVASEAEGFGLPVAEALSFGTAVIARDLDVFRDFAGDGLCLESFTNGEELATAIVAWIQRATLQPEMLSPRARVSTTWEASVEELLRVVVDGKWYRRV